MSAGDGNIVRDPDKEGGPLDWYGGGPRRRVAYDDLTAIDWIYEYSKERQRLRMLHSKGGGLLGQLYQLWDASQIWLVLVATGIASGMLAGIINIASNWLEDLKGGYCRQGPGGGRFYLNRAFCCWGLDGKP
jgi:chloride channel 3/4/5